MDKIFDEVFLLNLFFCDVDIYYLLVLGLFFIQKQVHLMPKPLEVVRLAWVKLIYYDTQTLVFDVYGVWHETTLSCRPTEE